MHILYPFYSIPYLTGVAFLKNVPEGTYDAVIVDSSDPIGTDKRHLTGNVISQFILASFFNLIPIEVQVQRRSFLRSHFLNQ